MNNEHNNNMAGTAWLRDSGARTERRPPRRFAGVQGRGPCQSALASVAKRPWPARYERHATEWPKGKGLRRHAEQAPSSNHAWCSATLSPRFSGVA